MWKTAFEKLSSTNITWSVLEYFISNALPSTEKSSTLAFNNTFYYIIFGITENRNRVNSLTLLALQKIYIHFLFINKIMQIDMIIIWSVAKFLIYLFSHNSNQLLLLSGCYIFLLSPHKILAFLAKLETSFSCSMTL